MIMNPVRNWHLFLCDLILLPVAAYASYLLRLESFFLLSAAASYFQSYIIFATISLIATLSIFRMSGVYARHWRYASVNELALLSGSVIASVVATECLSVLATLALGILPPPRTVPFIYFLLALMATTAPRLAIRVRIGSRTHSKHRGLLVPTLIIGAGDAGTMIARELQYSTHISQDVIGYIDDDVSKRGLKIRGIRVLGGRDDIPRLIEQYSIEQVIIALPSADGITIRKIVSICEQSKVQIRIMPGIYELLNGSVSVTQLRPVAIEDLLRREQIIIDTTAVRNLVKGRRVLVTGGGGSIGSELCSQLLQFNPAELVILGHGENSIFEIHNQLSKMRSSETRVTPVIADIRFADRISRIMTRLQPDIIFHAAAHKHVPLMEFNPCEAITTNIQGTRNVLNAALAANVSHFVMISTDKAVNPSSIMGASKRVAELLVTQAAQNRGKFYVAVRFGNVLGSRGSVVLTFKQQIAAGGPVMVTHPDMKRYFITIPEAVQLVLQAIALGKGGEVFLLDMGEPVKIVDIARELIELSGLKVGKDIEIAYSGIRPGEKLFEELVTSKEQSQRTKHDKISLVANVSYVTPDSLDDQINDLIAAAAEENDERIIEKLQVLVPEFTPQRGTMSSE